jgi:hemerythrin-like metal-binding protein
MDKKCLSLSKVDIEEIDKAHLEHVRLLKELSDAIETKTVTVKHLEKIMNSLRGHFEYEEGLMEGHNVPTIIPHKKAHKEMMYKFHNALASIGEADNAEKNMYVEYLQDLFLSHVNLWDSQYVPYINKENKIPGGAGIIAC